MRILLDTNVLLWSLFGDTTKLSDNIKKLLSDPESELFVSVASIWEVEIKHLKKPELMPISGEDIYEALLGTDAHILNIKFDYIQKLKGLNEENIHYDPFDQMIIATALKEDLALLSSDAIMAKYKQLKLIDC